MHLTRKKIWFIVAGLVMVVISVVGLMMTTPANAQCGSQASSCKNCHEVQGADPVNNDGNPWHESHAFGDFCYICHGGNQQATDKDAAHEGMVDPLSDVKAACQQCHAADLDARAKVYADMLGVDLAAASADTGSSGETATPAEAPAAAAASAAPASGCADLVVDDADAVDYVQRYDEIVLGKKPVNWGNVIFSLIILGLLFGGGTYIAQREHLIRISVGETKPVVDEYPAELVDALPKMAAFKAKARKTLLKILNNPQKAEKVLDLIATIVDESDEEA